MTKVMHTVFYTQLLYDESFMRNCYGCTSTSCTTGHEDTELQQRHSCALPLTLVLDKGGWLMPISSCFLTQESDPVPIRVYTEHSWQTMAHIPKMALRFRWHAAFTAVPKFFSFFCPTNISIM